MQVSDKASVTVMWCLRSRLSYQNLCGFHCASVPIVWNTCIMILDFTRAGGIADVVTPRTTRRDLNHQTLQLEQPLSRCQASWLRIESVGFHLVTVQGSVGSPIVALPNCVGCLPGRSKLRR